VDGVNFGVTHNFSVDLNIDFGMISSLHGWFLDEVYKFSIATETKVWVF
jgi:hypothetical protein